MNVIGERLAEALAMRGISQRRLAEEIDSTECSVSRYVKGERIPKATTIAKMAAVLNVSADYLLGTDYRYADSPFHALKNDDKYCWHDLRKHPEDTPHQAGHTVMLCLEGRTMFGRPTCEYSEGFMGYGDMQWYTTNAIFMRRSSSITDNRIQECFKVIAWKEIEPFEEEPE